jgi:hypothetical protein
MAGGDGTALRTAMGLAYALYFVCPQIDWVIKDAVGRRVNKPPTREWASPGFPTEYDPAYSNRQLPFFLFLYIYIYIYIY